MLFCSAFILLPFMASALSLAKRGAPSSAYAALNFSSVKDQMGSSSDRHTYTKGQDPIRGVNIGGWLTLEPWINTDLFSSANFDGSVPEDEFDFVASLGYVKAGQLLEDHYNTWITEADFAKMKSIGLNAVRIPIGYWPWKLMSTDKYYQGNQVKYLEKALGWARNHNLKVWIDLHGTPGSQNGYDSSGHKNFHDWNGYNNVAETKEILNYIFAKYGGKTYSDVVIGIELVNEPTVGGHGITQDFLSQFYADMVSSIRQDVGSNQNIILHDGYTYQGAWNGKPYNSDSGVIYDTHLYTLYDATLKSLDFDQKISQVCSWGKTVAGLQYKAVVGEMTAVWNADGNSIYTKSMSQWGQNDKDQLSRFAQAQFNAYEKNYGWFFWNWKLENAEQWDFQKLIDNGILPNPITNRTFNDCA